MAVHIRLAEEADAEGIAAIYRPIVESTVISFEVVPPDADEIARRIGETLPSYPWLVCDLGVGPSHSVGQPPLRIANLLW